MIEAKIILDSVNPAGVRLTTVSVTMPRFILAELNTHRSFCIGDDINSNDLLAADWKNGIAEFDKRGRL